MISVANAPIIKHAHGHVVMHGVKTTAVILAKRVQALDAELAVIDAELAPLVREAAPELIELGRRGIIPSLVSRS